MTGSSGSSRSGSGPEGKAPGRSGAPVVAVPVSPFFQGPRPGGGDAPVPATIVLPGCPGRSGSPRFGRAGRVVIPGAALLGSGRSGAGGRIPGPDWEEATCSRSSMRRRLQRSSGNGLFEELICSAVIVYAYWNLDYPSPNDPIIRRKWVWEPALMCVVGFVTFFSAGLGLLELDFCISRAISRRKRRHIRDIPENRELIRDVMELQVTYCSRKSTWSSCRSGGDSPPQTRKRSFFLS
jgi:hypothetical protein